MRPLLKILYEMGGRLFLYQSLSKSRPVTWAQSDAPLTPVRRSHVVQEDSSDSAGQTSLPRQGKFS